MAKTCRLSVLTPHLVPATGFDLGHRASSAVKDLHAGCIDITLSALLLDLVLFLFWRQPGIRAACFKYSMSREKGIWMRESEH